MTITDYLEQNITPKVGGVIWSPHSVIRTRGYPFVHKILDVKRKKRDGKLHYSVTIQTKAPSGHIAHKRRTVWLDEVD